MKITSKKERRKVIAIYIYNGEMKSIMFLPKSVPAPVVTERRFIGTKCFEIRENWDFATFH